MDHLPHPQEAAFPPVPYYGKYKYDGGSFAEYPLRCGFDKAKLREDLCTVPRGDHNSFFQAWLFFGPLHEFFGAFGATLDDFIDHQQKRVTTARLPHWAAVRHRSRPTCSLSKRAEGERLFACLREMQHMILLLDKREIRQVSGSYLEEEVAASIIVLGLTLEKVRDSICGLSDEDRETSRLGWPHGEFALKRLEDAGWCKSEISRLGKYLLCTGMLYCGYMPRLGRQMDHSSCSEHRCAAEDINEETYETAHANGCNGCEHGGPDSSDLASMLDGNSFPVIGLTKSETSDICISVLSCSEVTYTAITHVWADGLGNPRGNTLPHCQILQLYKLLQSINQTNDGRTACAPAAKTNTVYLWMDTLCIPLQKELRKKAIISMYEVYNKAKMVLVLDRSLMSISGQRPAEELCIRITASPWMRRAWTLLEGGLAKSLIVHFGDIAIDVRTLTGSLTKRMEDEESYVLTPLESCHAVLNVLDSGKVDPDQLQKVLRSLMYRSTSKPRDKLICFAIMMRYDMKRITDVDEEFRTQRVFEQLKDIPRNFLWHNGPKLDVPYFRWAPKDIFSVREVEDQTLAHSDCGLLVRAHGMVFLGRSHYISEVTERDPVIRDFTSGKWYSLLWVIDDSFDGSVVKFDAPWITLAVILQEKHYYTSTQKGAVIRLDRDLVMATPQELSNYLRCCDTISGEYIGGAYLKELDHIRGNQLEQIKTDFEDEFGPKVAFEKKFSDIAEEIRKGESRLEEYPESLWTFISRPMFWLEGEMQGSEQKWCVT